jgi:hypothetical protein
MTGPSPMLLVFLETVRQSGVAAAIQPRGLGHEG